MYCLGISVLTDSCYLYKLRLIFTIPPRSQQYLPKIRGYIFHQETEIMQKSRVSHLLSIKVKQGYTLFIYIQDYKYIHFHNYTKEGIQISNFV